MRTQPIIERFETPLSKTTMRVMNTTCPKCRKRVQFTMQSDECVAEENKYLIEQNKKAQTEIIRLNMIINRLIFFKGEGK